jgi:hypothetical protein
LREFIKENNINYAHIIRQIENGLADWTHDFSEVETPKCVVNIDQFPLFFHNENLTENIFYVDKKGNKTRFHLFLQFSFAHFVIIKENFIFL